jgi:hypothetical protein
MNIPLAFFIACSVIAFLVVLEGTGFHRGRWTLADLLKLTFLLGVLLAIGRYLAVG